MLFVTDTLLLHKHAVSNTRGTDGFGEIATPPPAESVLFYTDTVQHMNQTQSHPAGIKTGPSALTAVPEL